MSNGSPKLLRLGVAVMVLSAAIFLYGGYSMAQRVGGYYKAAPPAQFELKQLTSRTGRFFEHDLSITDGKMPDGRAALNITYGSSNLLLPTHPPAVSQAPGEVSTRINKPTDLHVYDEWVALVAILPVDAGRLVGSDNRVEGRVALVKRNAAPGGDDDMGGMVGRKFWTFDLLEFLPNGSVAPLRTMQFQATDYRTGEAYLPSRRQDPTSTVEAIEERSWEFQTVLYAIPKLQIANYRYKTDAIAGSAAAPGMGWTLPVTAFSVMGIVIGILLTGIGWPRTGKVATSN